MDLHNFNTGYNEHEEEEDECFRESLNEQQREQQDCHVNKSRNETDDDCLHHERCIVHIDIDCFYAQVKMIKNPTLKDVPLGIKQKSLIVTTNYAARQAGVPKSCWVRDALRLCPSLILINGEDLHSYRQFSQKIFDVLKSYKVPVERLGMDENFLDVTSLLPDEADENENVNLVGHSYRNNENTVGVRQCHCGCHYRLKMGSRLAKQIRDRLHTELSITSLAGISYNKVLAKMVGSRHKPDDQTTIFPCDVAEFLSETEDVDKIPGIGSVTSKTLTDNNLRKIHQVQQADLPKLNRIFEASIAKRIWELCRGVDRSEVKMSVAPKSIGLEDRFKGLYTKKECVEKLEWLLDRLLILLHEDGRLPSVVKVSSRDYFKDKIIKKFHRESRQGQINAHLFRSLNRTCELESTARSKVLVVIVEMLEKMVDMRGKFHLTLLGLSVSAFEEPQCKKKHEISNFFTNRNSGASSQTQTLKMKEKSHEVTPHFLSECSPSVKQRHVWENHSTRSTCDKRELLMENETESSANASLPPQPLAKKAKHSKSRSSLLEGSVCLPKIPAGWDQDVFAELPADVKMELLREQKLSFSDPQLQYDSTTTTTTTTRTNSTGFSTSCATKSVPSKYSTTGTKNIQSYFKKM